MCDYAAAAQAVLQVAGQASAYEGEKANWKAIVAAKKQEAANVVRSANYSFMDDEIDRRDAFEAAVQDIMKTRMNAYSLNSSVEAAVAENIGSGRTADLINRSSKAAEGRAVASIQDNYAQRSNEIDLNKERTLLNAQQTLAGIKAPPKPSKAPYILNSITSIWSAYTGYSGRAADAKADGLGYGWGGVKAPKNTSPTNSIGQMSDEDFFYGNLW